MEKERPATEVQRYSRVRRRAQEEQKKQEKIKKRIHKTPVWKLVVFVIVAVVFLVAGLAAGAASYHFTNLFEKVQPEHEILVKEVPKFTQKLNNGEPFSILLIGTDDRLEEEERGRADTIIVATVNPEKENVNIISIPRDTLITLPGTPDNIPDKINSTYAYGYIPYLQESVEDLLQIPIDIYATINFEGLVALVDAVDGIYLDSKFTFRIKDETTQKMVQIDEGRHLVNGRQALGYARMRKEDPEGDFGRQKRQQEVIQAILDRLLTFDTFSNLADILKVLGDNVETNLTTEQAQLIFSKYKQAAQQINRVALKGEPIDAYYLPHYGLNVFVFEVDLDALQRVRNRLQNHLELENYVNKLNDGYDSFIEGFPFHSDDAIDELDLGDYVDREQLQYQHSGESVGQTDSYSDNSTTNGQDVYSESYDPYLQGTGDTYQADDYSNQGYAY